MKIVTRKITQQNDLIDDLGKEYDPEDNDLWAVDLDDNTSSTVFESLYSTSPEGDFVVNMSTRKTLKEIQANLQDRREVFEELTTRVDQLERQVYHPYHGARSQTNSLTDSPTRRHHPRGPWKSHPGIHNCLDHLSSPVFRVELYGYEHLGYSGYGAQPGAVLGGSYSSHGGGGCYCSCGCL